MRENEEMREREKWGKAIGFSYRLLYLDLMYLATYNLCPGIPKQLNFSTGEKIIREKKSHLRHRRICVNCKLNRQPLKSIFSTQNCFY